ncbi:MAG: hypothetical protein O2788_00410 [Chloroflexi bacterium]|nr:hypothetical protein [Chloroflexota bacterium]
MKIKKSWIVIVVVIVALIGSLWLLPERDTPNPGVDPQAGLNK